MVINFDFRREAKKSGHLDYPLQSYGPKVITPPKKRRKKKRHGYNFSFQASILNQRGAIRYVLMLIQWQNLKRKIVAVSFFLDASYFC